MQASAKYKEKAEFTAEKYCDYSLRAPKDTICTEEDKQFLCRVEKNINCSQFDLRETVEVVSSRRLRTSRPSSLSTAPAPSALWSKDSSTDPVSPNRERNVCFRSWPSIQRVHQHGCPEVSEMDMRQHGSLYTRTGQEGESQEEDHLYSLNK